MASLLFTVGGAVVNALAFSGTNFVFNRLTNHGEKEQKTQKLKPLPPEPQLSDFYHPPERQKNGELLFVAAGTGIATYALYKYLK